MSIYANDNKYEKLEKRIEELEGQMTDYQLKDMMNRFSFNGWMINSYENFSSKNHIGSPKKRSNYMFKSKFQFNINADISDKLSFHGGLFADYLWGDTGPGFPSEQMDTHGSSLILSRAYFNYSPLDYFTIYVGRIPSMLGPPENIRLDQNRMGFILNLDIVSQRQMR